MPLSVEGVALKMQADLSPRQLITRAIEAPGLKRAAAQFEASPVLSVDARDKCLCVLQAESCTVPFDHGISVGSQDATTCVIAFVVTACGVSCLHVDEDTCDGDYLERSLRGINGTAELYLVGAYQDEESTSDHILYRLFSFYSACAHAIELKLAYVGAVNTQVKIRHVQGASSECAVPKICGAAFDPCSRTLRPANFRNRGPMIPERQARCLSGGHPADVYDAASRCLVVHPWRFELETETLRTFQMLAALSDEELLKHTSTSPDAEPPTFLSDMRACLDKLIERPCSAVFFRSLEPMRFAWKKAATGAGEGSWELVT